MDVVIDLGVITLGERAEIFGMTPREQHEAELLGPWQSHWAVRFGALPDRVRAYHAAGRPPVDRRALAISGDPEIVEVVRATVDRLPDLVAACLVEECYVQCGGHSTRGWNGVLPELTGRWQTINLSIADAATFAHEAAHAVHRRRPDKSLTSAQWERAQACLAALTVQCGKMDELTDEQMERESAADALARAWGFALDSTTGACGQRRRRDLVADLERRSGGR